MPRIFDEFVVLKPDMQMDSLSFGPDFYESLEKNYSGFKSHCLVSAHEFSENWNTWEIHPHGDEMVVLVAGSAELVLRRESGDESVKLLEPGSYLVVPKNTWHTAFIEKHASLLFITPGEGTLNESEPQVVPD